MSHRFDDQDDMSLGTTLRSEGVTREEEGKSWYIKMRTHQQQRSSARKWGEVTRGKQHGGREYIMNVASKMAQAVSESRSCHQ